MFSIFTHVVLHDTHTVSLGDLWFKLGEWAVGKPNLGIYLKLNKFELLCTLYDCKEILHISMHNSLIADL